MSYPSRGGFKLPYVKSSGSLVKPVVGDVWTVITPTGIEPTSLKISQNRGAGYVDLTMVGATHTVDANDIMPVGSANWPVIARDIGPLNLAGKAQSVTNPPAVPGAPTIGTATAGNGQAGVAFTAPASDGGAAITSYLMYANGSDGSVLGPQTAVVSPMFFSGLTNGVSYTFRVLAVNSVGTGPLSAASNAVVPSSVPANLIIPSGFDNATVRAKIASLKAGTISRMIINIFGDSTTVGSGVSSSGNPYLGAETKSIVGALALELASRTGLLVQTESDWGSHSTGFASNAQLTLSGIVAADPSAGNKVVGGQMYSISGAGGTGTESLTSRTPVDTADIWYLGGPSLTASFTINADGGATLATPTPSTSPSLELKKVTVSLGSLGIHTVNCVKSVSAGAWYIFGIDMYNSTVPSISIRNWGATSRKISDITGLSAAYSPVNTLQRSDLQGDLLICDMTINTAALGSASDLANYQANWGVLLNNVMSAKYMVTGLPYDETTNTPTTPGQTHAQVITQLKAYAAAQSLMCIDANARWVNFATANANGFFFTDKLHGTALGYTDKAKLFADAILF